MNKKLNIFFLVFSIACSTSLQSEIPPVNVADTKWFRVVCPAGNDVKDLSQPMHVQIGQVFGIQTRLPYPGKPYEWHAQDQWQLIQYPMDQVILELERSAIPECYGHDLTKWWVFKAHKAGSFEIVLQRDRTQEVVIHLIIEE